MCTERLGPARAAGGGWRRQRAITRRASCGTDPEAALPGRHELCGEQVLRLTRRRFPSALLDEGLDRRLEVFRERTPMRTRQGQRRPAILRDGSLHIAKGRQHRREDPALGTTTQGHSEQSIQGSVEVGRVILEARQDARLTMQDSTCTASTVARSAARRTLGSAAGSRVSWRRMLWTAGASTSGAMRASARMAWRARRRMRGLQRDIISLAIWIGARGKIASDEKRAHLLTRCGRASRIAGLGRRAG